MTEARASYPPPAPPPAPAPAIPKLIPPAARPAPTPPPSPVHPPWSTPRRVEPYGHRKVPTPSSQRACTPVSRARILHPNRPEAGDESASKAETRGPIDETEAEMKTKD